MDHATITRRGLLKGGGTALAGWSVLQVSGPAAALGGDGGGGRDRVRWVHSSDLPETYPGQPGDVVVPWTDPPAPVPPPAESVVGNLLEWESLTTRLTPADDFFTVKHYDLPLIDPTTWQVEITGLVDRPVTLSLADLMARPQRRVEFTLECSGNTGLPFFIGGIGNAVWGGAQLSALLRSARPRDEASEVVFWGDDAGSVTIRDNSGVTGAGLTGSVAPDDGGALDLTITEQFARSMSLADAMSPGNLLCYEMNGEPLPPEHGAPVRLIAPGWYGVANVKWLTRIEVTDHRYAGRFMARDYVTFRERTEGDTTTWTFETVGRDRLKSAPAKVVENGGTYRVIGVAWGDPIAAVEVSIDGGPWQPAELVDTGRRRDEAAGTAWRFWTFDWGAPAPGEHTVASRAIDRDGEVQPAQDDPLIAGKHTYWESNGQITRTVDI
jgi:DMSO/TMAO reductase YedYZ molybdopterin-dependent catalytic subunit